MPFATNTIGFSYSAYYWAVGRFVGKQAVERGDPVGTDRNHISRLSIWVAPEKLTRQRGPEDAQTSCRPASPS